MCRQIWRQFDARTEVQLSFLDHAQTLLPAVAGHMSEGVHGEKWPSPTIMRASSPPQIQNSEVRVEVKSLIVQSGIHSPYLWCAVVKVSV